MSHGDAAALAPAAPRRPKAPVGDPIIECRDLCRYFGNLKAVNHVSFRAYRGQVLGFIGPNGSGKTTTMRILATLDVPTAGDAFIDGYSVIDDPDMVRKRLGFMPDSFGKYANMNVVEYLDFFARSYGFRGAKRRDAVERVLVFTELRKLAEKSIDTLSKGMSQRLGLGRTLIHDPDVLILDEPAAGLDPRARIELRELIHVLATDLKKTILISSHILTELGEICDSAAIIEAGRILASGTIEELLYRQRESRGHASKAPLVISLVEESKKVESWMLEQPFVSDVAVAGENIACHFEGDRAAQHQLLKRMVEAGFEVAEFRGRTESLEDAFMAITRGIMQ